MGFYVHIHVAFACDDFDPLAACARKHLAMGYVEADREAAAFLEDLAGRTGTAHRGPKGGLCLWGWVGNYASGERFAETLRPFWIELLSAEDLGDDSEIGPFSFERIIIFEEREQTEAATAYEIFWDEPDREDRQLVIREHPNLPFSWKQF